MNEFMGSSKDIIINFLQTVVIIDDEAFLDETCNDVPTEGERATLPANVGRQGITITTQYTEIQPEATVPPAAPAAEEETVPAETPAEIEEETVAQEAAEEETVPLETPIEITAHKLNAKLLSDKFAEQGLLCTALRPVDDEIENYKKVLKKADIVILDWKLQAGDDGRIIKDLIKDIIKDSDGNPSKSLRNIVIYSGENDLKEKLVSVKSELYDILGVPTSSSNNCLIFDKLQITIYAKEVQRVVQEGIEKVSVEDLVPLIINDFVLQVAGLVPNMAIQSLAKLRQNTHEILGVFSKELDEAYLSHRLMLPNSSDAESFMINILISELEAILLNSNEISQSINIENIMNWFDNKFNDDDYKRLLLNDFVMCKVDAKLDGAKDFFNYTEPIATLRQNENLAELLNQKLSNDKVKVKELVAKLFTDNLQTSVCKLIKQNDKKMKKLNDFSKFLYSDASDAIKVENKFATLSILQTKYSSPKPYLTLGSIIKNTHGKYFLCIIPRCDAVRKKVANHSYPFLQLKDDNDTFSLIINDDEYKKFTILDKPEELLI